MLDINLEDLRRDYLGSGLEPDSPAARYIAALEQRERQLIVERDEFERLGSCDGLTGVHNRRGFEEAYRRTVGRMRRCEHDGGEGLEATILMVDVDGFKNINDTYGHPAGDYVLREVATRIGSEVRETDAFGRYGGDEFVVLVEGDIEAARRLGERIMESIKSEPVVYRPSGHEGIHIPVGISMGMAPIHGSASLDDVIRAADTCLYGAKHAGKGRLVVADGGDRTKPRVEIEAVA